MMRALVVGHEAPARPGIAVEGDRSAGRGGGSNMHARGRQIAESQDTYSLIAGATCLDFLNTVGGRRGNQTQEYLRTYSDLVRWSRQAGLLQNDLADRLLQDSAARADEAEAILAQAIVLREALYRIFTRLLD